VRAIAGRIAAAAGDLPQAAAHYERSAAVTPNHDALAALATLAKARGDEEAAARLAERVLAFHDGHSHGEDHSHDPGSGNALLARFLADHELDPPRALREARAAHARYPNIATTDTLAWCLLKSGRPKEARAMIRRAMKWGTPDAELDFHAGMIEQALGDDTAARLHFGRALGRDPAFHPLHAKTASDLLRR
jgi:tetratricopeptide (TPR) repeat protein